MNSSVKFWAGQRRSSGKVRSSLISLDQLARSHALSARIQNLAREDPRPGGGSPAGRAGYEGACTLCVPVGSNSSDWPLGSLGASSGFLLQEEESDSSRGESV